MKILAPLNSLENYRYFLECGADEFYLGYEDLKWEQQFGTFNELNKMSSIKGSDIVEWENLSTTIEKLKQISNKPIYITLNGFTYTDEKCLFLERRIKSMSQMNIDGIIVGAPELIKVIRDCGIAVHVSSMANVYNQGLVEYYKQQGVSRIILPRDLTLDEISSIKECAKETEIEVFLMRIGCRYSDPNCLCLHGGEHGGICAYLNRSKRNLNISHLATFEEKNNFLLTNYLYEKAFHVLPACGLCAIWRLYKSGVDSCKIVGRYENTEEVAEDIRLVRFNIDIAKQCSTEEEYLAKMKTHSKNKQRCLLSLGCYYPEVRF